MILLVTFLMLGIPLMYASAGVRSRMQVDNGVAENTFLCKLFSLLVVLEFIVYSDTFKRHFLIQTKSLSVLICFRPVWKSIFLF